MVIKTNPPHSYLITNEEGKVVETFRLKLNAIKFIGKNQKYGRKLNIVIPEKKL